MEAIDKLPLMYKMVFKLRAIENRTYAEIAEELEISELRVS
jgi:DNA-directed RNA polymerase specialized sigma24 family protein